MTSQLFSFGVMLNLKSPVKHDFEILFRGVNIIHLDVRIYHSYMNKYLSNGVKLRCKQLR